MRAAADGEIARVRVSETGYGRALDLALPDGRVVVYAHLSLFSEAVEESCGSRQKRSDSLDLDWRPARGTFRFLRGDVLGWTGMTASGRGLLHLEVLVDGVPRNPLRNGFSWPDRASPRIHAIRFVPLGPTARIDGRLEAEVIDVERVRDGEPGGVRTILWGPVGIECESSDDAGGQRRAPFQVRLDVDGSSHSVADVGARTPGAAWDAEDPDPATPQILLQRLYRPSERDRGRLLCGTAIPPGAHTIRVTAKDASGNVDSASVFLLVEQNPRVEEWIGRPVGRGDWDIGVRVGPPASDGLEEMRLTVEVTEDGVRFPVETKLGHLSDGWFLGSISAISPTGRAGMRVRMRTRTGLEAWGPTLSLDRAGQCAFAEVDSPSVRALYRWIEIREESPCIPAAAPKGLLQAQREALPCDLLDVGRAERNEGGWRFVASPPRRGHTGSSPYFHMEVDGKAHRWRLPSVVAAGVGEDLLWTTPDGALTVEIPAGTFYAPVWLSWEKAPRRDGRISPNEIPMPTGTAGQGEVLIARSDAHRLEPAGIDVDAPFRIAIRPHRPPTSSDEARRLGIFGRSGPSSPWVSRGGLWTGSAVVAVVDRLEEWIVLEDGSEPWIYGMDPAQGERKTGRLPSLGAQVREDGSGVTAASFEVYLDGRRVPAGWNPWSRKLTATLFDSLASGSHRWEVLARDAAGNASRRAATFTWTPQR